MATQHGVEHAGFVDRLFLDHPRSLGMTWAAHAIGALRIGAQLLAASLACLIHALVPGVFTETAGRTVASMYGHMQQRQAGAANPGSWPEL